jgi:hypothetical protein
MQYAVKSEVWAFRTGDTTAAGPGDNTVYLVMDGRSGGSEAIAPDILHIKYTSATSAHTAVLVLKAEDGTTMARKNISLQQGDNYLHISLSGKFQSKLRYTAVLQEPDGKAASLSFTIK